MAAEILPLAEREGLSADVDRWVVSRCMLVMAERQRQMRPVRLFVSQSMEAALDSSRTGWLRQLLETRRLSGEMLVLEFKLQEVLAHLNDFVSFAKAIADLGVSISISTFDVKENSLQLLERFPIAYIKLATRYGGTNLRDTAVREELRTIVNAAHHHGAKGDRLAHRRRTERLAVVERRHRLSARRLRAAGRPGSGVRLQCHHGLTRAPAA